MPKDTFFNLPEEKQKKIFEAAVEEFSQRRFSEASINQIVKNAEISRGSFYQYFADKEDLYMYMISVVAKEKTEVIGLNQAHSSDLDFFDSYMHMLSLALEWTKRKPEYTKIGMLMELDDSAFIQKLLDMGSEGFAKLGELIKRDQKRGLVRPDVDPKLVVDIVYTLNFNFMKDYMSQETYDVEGMVEKARQVLNIIKHGVVQEPPSAKE